MATDLGTGGSVAFTGDGGLTNVELTAISWSGINRAMVDVSHLGTTNARVFKPGDLYDAGELSLDCHFEMDYLPAMNTTGVMTVTIFEGGTNTIDWTANAFFQSLEWTAPFEDKMTGTLTFKLSGVLAAT